MPVDISKWTKDDVARRIDLAILRPEWQDKQQLEGCEWTKKYKFASYYVLPHWVPLLVREIGDFCKENNVKIGTGIGFPYGSNTTVIKLAEAEDQIKIGATVLDMVANISWIKDKKYDLYAKECNAFVKVCHDAGLLAKVIIQVGFFNDEEAAAATKIVAESGAEYVKTATGTGPQGRPDFNDVQVMLKTLGEVKETKCQLKVSGIIPPIIFNAYSFLRMGAGLIGTRSAVEVVESLPKVKELLYPN